MFLGYRGRCWREEEWQGTADGAGWGGQAVDGVCSLSLLSQDMWDQEKKHLEVMNKVQREVDARPTMLWEVAKVAGFGLGAVTALMGKEAAMACTEAVETTIGEHYNEYVVAHSLHYSGSLIPE